MSERQEPYITATAPIGNVRQIEFTVSEWERNVILRMRQLSTKGLMILIDGDAHCWYEVGKLECNKEDRRLPFEM